MDFSVYSCLVLLVLTMSVLINDRLNLRKLSQPNSDGLQPCRDGLQLDGLQPIQALPVFLRPCFHLGPRLPCGMRHSFPYAFPECVCVCVCMRAAGPFALLDYGPVHVGVATVWCEPLPQTADHGVAQSRPPLYSEACRVGLRLSDFRREKDLGVEGRGD